MPLEEGLGPYGRPSDDPNSNPFGLTQAQFCQGEGVIDGSHATYATNGTNNYGLGYGPTELIVGTNSGGGANRQGIGRGHIVNRCPFNRDGTNRNIPKNTRFKFNFLYNPSALNMEIGIDTGLFSPDQQSQIEQTNYFGSSQSQRTFSFDLFLDRTVELMRFGNAQATTGQVSASTREMLALGPGRIGVYYDILYLQQVVGIFDAGQPATFQLVDFYWSQLHNPIVWSGFITGIRIDYTHFTPKMIPMRAVVSVQFQERWSGNAETNTTPSTTGTTTPAGTSAVPSAAGGQGQDAGPNGAGPADLPNGV